VPLESALFFETPEQIWARVFRSVRPRTPVPQIEVQFCRFANVNSTVRLENGRMLVRISDLLNGAPAPIHEALAWILISKLYRKPVPRSWSHRYRLFLNRREVRRSIQLVRQERGRKYISGPQGEVYNLEELFEELNFRYFHGLMARPDLSWSRQRSRRMLGHYDAAHNAIVLSRILDRPQVPRVAVEYVMFHEMLHLRHPVEHKGVRRCVHTREFREAENEFEHLADAKAALKKL
jgi:hypothetical protein